MIDSDETSYTSRRRREAKRVPWYTGLVNSRAVIVTVAVVIALPLVLFGLAEAVATPGRVHPGVSVGGVSVGGLDVPAATAKLGVELPKRAAAPVTVVAGDESWTIKGSDLTVGYDVDALVASAMLVGRSGRPLKSLSQRVSAWFSPVEIQAIATVDPAQLSTFEDSIDEKVAVKPVDASVDVDGTTMKVIPSKAGKGLQRKEFEALLLPVFAAEKREVTAPVGTIEAAVSDAAAATAAKQAEAFVSAPAIVTYSGKSWTFQPETIAKWIAFTTSTDSTTGPARLEAAIASDAVGASLLPKVGVVGQAPVDARFKTRSGQVTIVPSKAGTGPDMVALSSELGTALSQTDGPRTVELKIATKEPELTTEEAKAMGVTERISTYTTTYGAGNKPRVNNIHLLGDSLDGKLIPPGGTFSFNGSVGERTAAKGYKEANAIVNGKLVPQLGGGICQVGTTLFNAVFLSGFPVLERHNHSFYIDHYPKGRDATVSWGGPDLKWKNDTDKWVLVSVSYTNSSITIALYGTDPGYDVSTQTSGWSNERPYPTEEIKDPTMVQGARVVEDGGITGRTCTVTRIVRKDGAIIRTDKFVSKYKPKIEVVRVGTKPKPSKTTTP